MSLQAFLAVFQAVQPSGNTTFEVVFLARQDGNVENTLYIHTSQGSFKYQVSVTERDRKQWKTTFFFKGIYFIQTLLFKQINPLTVVFVVLILFRL